MLNPHHATSGAFAALLAQAGRQPQAEALRCKRRGAWWVHSWSQLAEDVQAAAQGWAASGVRAGDTLTVLGPLGAPLIVSLFAADALGAAIAVEASEDEATLIRRSRLAGGDASHEGERRPATGARMGAAGHDATRARVLADFDPSWRDGIDFIRNAWPEAGSLLLVPEPGGDATADRIEARATRWLAPARRLVAFEQTFADRAPSSGLAAAAVRSVRQGRGGPIGGWVRARLAANLGIGSVREVRSDGDLPESTRALLVSLGMSVASPNAAALAHAVSQSPAPTERRFDSALVGSAS